MGVCKTPLLPLGQEHDADWEAWLQTIPVGAQVQAQERSPEHSQRLRVSGFVETGTDYFERRADLVVSEPIVSAQSEDWPALDAVVIPTVFRAAEQSGYLHTTLESLFAICPNGIDVNLFLGDPLDHHVLPDVLADRFGQEQASRIHVHRLAAGTWAHLRDNFRMPARCAFNHARALRSGQHLKNVLFMEDDVLWTKNAMNYLRAWAQFGHVDFISFYHTWPYSLNCHPDRPCRQKDIKIIPAAISPKVFCCTQAVLYFQRILAPLCRFISLRLNSLPVDLLVGSYSRQANALLGVSRPSFVQHIGRRTSGLSEFHQARCFVEDLASFSARAEVTNEQKK